ncbi:hypothetical protein [Aliikangiella sp. G2MR2-5]|uniref:hypothetical protein n=1 Tax=Aliikangiella sp. G2MR2-5 TaxID=2788943 RepID=UPI0018A9C1B8|nr:hypothetical protein [Aliikangiella sp. G2MR2-5]
MKTSRPIHKKPIHNVGRLALSALFSLYFLSVNVSAGELKQSSISKLQLNSCKVNVTADEILKLENSVEFRGNVEVLVGFASLKVSKARLIKQSDGKCELITHQN